MSILKKKKKSNVCFFSFLKPIILPTTPPPPLVVSPNYPPQTKPYVILSKFIVLPLFCDTYL